MAKCYYKLYDLQLVGIDYETYANWKLNGNIDNNHLYIVTTYNDNNYVSNIDLYIGDTKLDANANEIYFETGENTGLTIQEVVEQLQAELSLIDLVGQKTPEDGEIFNDYKNNIAGRNAHAEGNNTQAGGLGFKIVKGDNGLAYYDEEHKPEKELYLQGGTIAVYETGWYKLEGYSHYTNDIWNNYYTNKYTQTFSHTSVNVDNTGLYKIVDVDKANRNIFTDKTTEDGLTITINIEDPDFDMNLFDEAEYIHIYTNASFTIIYEPIFPYNPGDKWSGSLNWQFPMFGEILAIRGDWIQVSNYVKGLAIDEDFSFYVHNKPKFGNYIIGFGQHSEGESTVAIGQDAHAEGRDTIAVSKHSHTEGRDTMANFAAHSEGWQTRAFGETSHAEGRGSVANGYSAHAEGRNTVADGPHTHSEGEGSQAIGENSHAAGYYSRSEAPHSYAGGYKSVTKSDAQMSFAHGSYLVASTEKQAVFGMINKEDPDAYFIVGNGIRGDETEREGLQVTPSNAFVVKKDGRVESKGKITANGVNLNDAIDANKNSINSLENSMETAINVLANFNDITAISVKSLPEYGNTKNIYVTPDSNYVYMTRKYPDMTNAYIWKGGQDSNVPCMMFRGPQIGNVIDPDYKIEFTVTTPEQLSWLFNNFSDYARFEYVVLKLENDIFLNDIYKINWETGDVSAEDYTPNSWFEWDNTNIVLPPNFIFEGNGHTIYGLYRKFNGDYAKTLHKGCSLFPPSTNSGSVTIKNLRISMSHIKHLSISSAFIDHTDQTTGSLTFENCGIEDDVYIGGYYPGGFVGVTTYNLVLRNCYSLAKCDSTGEHKKDGDGGTGIDKSEGTFCGNVWKPAASTVTTSIINCYTAANYFGYGGRLTDASMGTNSYNKSIIKDNDLSNMQGLDVLINLNKMPLLAENFIADYSYPINKKLAYGWYQLNSNNAVSRDIASALDNIIAIQESLISGNYTNGITLVDETTGTKYKLQVSNEKVTLTEV